MTTSHIIFLLILFAVVVGLVLLAMTIFSPNYMRERLASFDQPSEPSALESNGWVEKVVKAAQPFSRLSLPEEGWEQSALRTRFMNAGWRTSGAATLYFAAKTLLALIVPSIAAVAMVWIAPKWAAHQFMLPLLLAVAFG